jgi:GDPmannose 4,6-dehydratase
MKRALITGITGQDAAYLAAFLLDKGYFVTGAYRRGSSPNFWRLDALGIKDRVVVVPFDLSDMSSILKAFEIAKPDECYHLAAQSFVPVSFEQPCYVGDVNALGTARMLEGLRLAKPDCRFYQASTSEMFGDAKPPQREDTPFHPRSPYAAAKVYAHHMAVNYREAYNLHISCGTCFNHESPLRGEEFVTKKITSSLARLKLGKQAVLKLGNIDACRDWGFAGDYVEAMWLMLQRDIADDTVICTGETHSVQDFVEAAARPLGLEIEWAGHGQETVGLCKDSGKVLIEIDQALYRPADHECLKGDPANAQATLGWTARTGLTELAELMVAHDLAMARV